MNKNTHDNEMEKSFCCFFFYSSVVMGWYVEETPTDGDDDVRFDVRGWRCGIWLDDDDGIWEFVGVVWTIVDDAFRTFDVLNVRVTMTGAGELEESI